MTAFDTLAPTYDAEFTHSPIGKILRNRVHQRLLNHFQAGDKVLELGCGTGEDALFLAQQGIHITATDASPKMLEITRQKTQHLENISCYSLDLTQLEIISAQDTELLFPSATSSLSQQPLPRIQGRMGGGQGFNGAFSNFGALNCLSDWKALAAFLAQQMDSGAILGLGIMSPFCAWEFLWHALHWKWEIALRRLRGSEFEGISIHYPTVKRITDDFSPYFRRVKLMPLGLFLPTSALFNVVQKRPKLMNTLVNLEQRFGNIPQLSLLADHYWIELERL